MEAAAKLSSIGRAGFASGDATIEGDVKRVTSLAVEFMGGLDTLVMSAGASGVGSILEESEKAFRDICDANLLSAAWTTGQYFAVDGGYTIR